MTVSPHPPIAQGADARPSVRGLLPLLRSTALRRLVLVRLLTSLGDGAFQGALAGAVLFDPTRRSSPSDIAAGFAVLLLPYSLIGPFAGALLDRWSRRQVLVIANIFRSVVIAVLSVLLAFGANLTVLLCFALVVVGAGRFVGSGLSASVPHVIAEDSLVGANSLSTTVGSIATLAGGGYGLGLRTGLGGGPIATAVVTASVMLAYLGSGVLASRFSVTALGPDETDEPPQTIRAVLDGFGAGLRHVIHRRTVALAICMVVLFRMCFGLAILVVLLLFQHHFTHHYGILRTGVPGITEVLGVSAVGLFLGAVATAPMVRIFGRTPYVVGLLVMSAVVVAVAGAQFTMVSTIITSFVLAFAYQSSKVCGDTVVQSDCDDAHIGRVFALYDTATNVFYVLAFVIGVRLVPDDGHSLGVVILVAVVYLLTAALYGFGMRGRTSGTHHGAPQTVRLPS